MKILVTGGSGFIGTNLVQKYADSHHEVLNIDIQQPRNPVHNKYWKQADISKKNTFEKIITDYDPDIVFHMAARTDLDGKTIEDYRANTAGVQNLIQILDSCKRVSRVIFASSRLVCKIGYQPKHDEDYCPDTIYGISKQLSEQIIRKNNGSYISTIVRPTSIWGPWFDVPYKNFFMAISRGLYVHPQGHTILKSFGYVGNTIYQLSRLAEADAESVDKKTLYLADYPAIDVLQLAKTVQQHFGSPPVRSVPLPIMKVGAKIGDVLKYFGMHNPPLTSYRLSNLTANMVYDLSATERLVGPLPYSLDQGVRETYDWLINHPSQRNEFNQTP